MPLPVYLAGLAIAAIGHLGAPQPGMPPPGMPRSGQQPAINEQATGLCYDCGRRPTVGAVPARATPGRRVISLTSIGEPVGRAQSSTSPAMSATGGRATDKRLIWFGAMLFGAFGIGSTVWLHLRVRPDLLTPENAAAMYDDTQPSETPPV